MKCRDVYQWLFAAEDLTTPPPEVQHHLERCPRCHREYQRLLTLEQAVQQAPLPPDAQEARDRFLEMLNEVPTPRPLAARANRGPRRRLVIGFGVAALLAVVVLGIWWFCLRGQGHPAGPGVVEQPASDPSVSRAQDQLQGHMLEFNLRLAEAVNPLEQTETLACMAADLRDAILKEAGSDPPADLALLTALHERVVRQGLVRSAWALAPRQQPSLAPIIRQLVETEIHAERIAAEVSPPAAAHLRTLAVAAHDVAGILLMVGQTDLPPEPKFRTALPATFGGSQVFLSSLVIQGLRLVEEPDPLRRADYCNDLTDRLVQSILLAHSHSETDRAVALGKHLANVLERGVHTNLARFSPVSAEDPRLAEMERISHRANQILTVLEADLKRAPPEARADLEEMMRASSEGREKVLRLLRDKRRGKGGAFPPGHNKSGFIPPGHHKESPPPGRQREGFLPPGQLKKALREQPQP